MSSGEITSNPSSIEVKLCYLIQLPVYLTVKNMSIHNQEKGVWGGGVGLKEEEAITITVVQARGEIMGPKDKK